jgi:hypothetical protein
MSKICVNRHVFWSRNETKMSGKVKSVMSDHVLVVSPDGTQHIVASSILSTKPIDKLALLSCPSMVKTADGGHTEQELQDFLVGLHIEINLDSAKVTVDAIDADGAPAEEHSKLLGHALEAVAGGAGVIRLTDDALERKGSEQATGPKQVGPVSIAPSLGLPPPPPPPPPGTPPPPSPKTKVPPRIVGPVGM